MLEYEIAYITALAYVLFHLIVVGLLLFVLATFSMYAFYYLLKLGRKLFDEW
ncbi:hypothetical protein [Phascolarctobacterium succinatutens]|jgi:hypothetical protein|uniref:hypothetical protein n=1 Tax=Phascolarctobacterium succinatutens TaxID=626940 RepID=UPI00206B28AD|nr:MAG TPA: hypothetical protein [Caudoviricetes sp.]